MDSVDIGIAGGSPQIVLSVKSRDSKVSEASGKMVLGVDRFGLLFVFQHAGRSIESVPAKEHEQHVGLPTETNSETQGFPAAGGRTVTRDLSIVRDVRLGVGRLVIESRFPDRR